MPENGVTAPTKDIQGIEAYIKGSIPLDLSDNSLASIRQINDSALLIDSELSGALFGVGEKGKAPSVTGNIDELKKGGLVSVIPNGFLLLHNDLQALSSPKGGKEESKDSGGKLSFLSDFVKGFAGAAAAMALFGGGKNTSDSLQGVIEELDADISADDYKDDPEVAATKKAAVLGYLKMYYNSQTASLAGEAVGNAASSAVTSFVTGVVGDLFNAILGREDNPSATSLEYIATTLDSSMTMEELGLNDGGEYREVVVAEKRKAVANYLATYYGSQVASLVANETASTLTDVASELVGGTLRKIVEKVKGKEENSASLESFVSVLDASMSMEELGLAEGGEHRDTVLKEKRIATAAYLAAYYTGQVASLAANEAAGTASDVASELVGGTLRKIYDKVRGREEEAASLSTFVSTLDSSMTMEELGLARGGDRREDVLKEKRKATASYLASYYNSQIAGLKSNSAASSISDFAAELATGTLSKIFGKLKGTEEDSNSLASFVASLDSSMTMEDLGITPGGKYREEIAEEKRKATKSYLAAFYSSQTPTSSTISSDEKVSALTRNTLLGLYDTDTAESSTSLKTFVDELDKSMTMEDLGLAPGGAYREEAVEEKRKTVAAYISTYYANQLASIEETSSNTLTDAVSLAKKTLQGLFKNSEDTDNTSNLTSLVDQLDSGISLEELGLDKNGANRAKITDVQANAVTEYLRIYYSSQIDSLTKELGSNATGSSVTTAVKGFFNGLFNKKSPSSDPFLESLKAITENLGADIDISKFTYNSNPVIKDTIDSGISEYLAELLSREKAALIDSIDDRTLKAAAKEALTGVKLDLKPLASLVVNKPVNLSDDSVESNSVPASTYDDRSLLRKLDTIVESLENMLSALSTEREGTTVITTGNRSTYSVDEEFRIQ